jgi:hypothetical protein
MLKIVDCASADCAVTMNKRATNNPERTLKLFTVVNPPFFIECKKKAQQHRPGDYWTSLSSEFFAAQRCATRQICNSLAS